MVDVLKQKILLGKHKSAGLWLPSGGHVEPDEYPVDTVKRECQEELNFEPIFLSFKPFFITMSHINERGIFHKDVPLWYVLNKDSNDHISFCKDEYDSVKWFSIDHLPRLNQCDPNMERFRDKLLLNISHWI